MYRVCCVVVGIALFLPLWMLAQARTSSAAPLLAGMQDKSRPLLIFYPQGPNEQPLRSLVEKQRSLFEGHQAELEDRNVVLTFVPSANGLQPTNTLVGLRRQFHVDDREFTVVLLGKDGGEKFRSYLPVTMEKLNALIDAMPMRQREIKDGHHAE